MLALNTNARFLRELPSGGAIPRRLALLLAGLLAGAGLVFPVLGGTAAAVGEEEDEDSPALKAMSPGARAAQKDCVMCHMFPSPVLANKKHWKEQILPRMMTTCGVALPDYSSSPEGELIRERRLYPDKPYFPVEDWPLIQNYYLTEAPDNPAPQDPREEIQVGLKNFVVERPRWRYPTPSSTLVEISSKTNLIYVGDDFTKSMSLMDAGGRRLQDIKLGNVPVDVVERPDGVWVVCIGSFIPSEHYRASVLFLPRTPEGLGAPEVVLKDLPRSVHAEFADFNGDGKEDIALCMFGNLTGRFSWFEGLGDRKFKEHVLSAVTGAIHCVVKDFNHDGKPDLALMMAQQHEMVLTMINDGKGNFAATPLIQFPPIYGHVWFEYADFNGDGREDLLLVNGDNGEYPSPLKKYHGIRVCLQRPDGEFEPAYFYPLNGAYKAVARDFDGDGDMDIAAISFFPDYTDSPRESFVYLENLGGMRFKATTFPECISGRWITMDAGDIDGDGDIDIVLGAYIQGPTSVPQFLMDMWKNRAPSALILKNTLKERGKTVSP